MENKIIQEKDIKNILAKNCNTFSEEAFKQMPISYHFKMVDISESRRILNNTVPSIDNIVNNTTYTSRGATLGSMVRGIPVDKIEDINLLKGFNEEIDRINKNKFKKYHGNPVSYLISYRNRGNLVANLVNTLCKNNRLLSRYVTNVNTQYINISDIDKIYNANMGGTILFEIKRIENSSDDIMAKSVNNISIGAIEKIISNSVEYSPSVLTILAIKDISDAKILNDVAKENKQMIVSLLPNMVKMEDTLKHLNALAKADGFQKYSGKELKEDVLYSPNQIRKIYDEWKHNHLITAMGYDKISNYATDTKLSFDPMRKLNNMIGLKNVKEITKQIISYFKMQKVYLDKGITTSTPCRHMVFYGNPGTAKTTVARLLTNILKEDGIISKDKIIEVGRSQLVGAYVGHTAINVRNKIREAKGGVLFIDEAYSLVDHHAGSYGDEAINTLVEEMDKIREDTIVILAGYPDKMQQFMDTNPGLRSRIGFHVKFDNYSKDELMQILLLLAKKEKFTFTKEALKLAEREIDTAINTKDFGNGRFVRTLVEQAIMKQATRIAKDNKYIDMDTKDILTIESDDISIMSKSEDEKKLGFLA
jgi:AAA+ superfamily predicted ATPase